MCCVAKVIPLKTLHNKVESLSTPGLFELFDINKKQWYNQENVSSSFQTSH